MPIELRKIDNKYKKEAIAGAVNNKKVPHLKIKNPLLIIFSDFCKINFPFNQQDNLFMGTFISYFFMMHLSFYF